MEEDVPGHDQEPVHDRRGDREGHDADHDAGVLLATGVAGQAGRPGSGSRLGFHRGASEALSLGTSFAFLVEPILDL